MSSILKALRKIEAEKRVVKHAAPDLRADQGRAPAKSRQVLPLLTGIALGAVFVGLFFIWSSKNSVSVAKHQPAAKTDKTVSIDKQAMSLSDVRQGEVAINPAVPVASSQPINNSGRDFENLAVSSKTTEIVVPAEPLADAQNRNETVSKLIAKPTIKGQKKPEASSSVSSLPTMTQTPTVVAVSASSSVNAELPENVSLLVTEIFYQEESANSMAVVNDLPVMVGTHVDSAVVLKILPDTVLFKIGDETFDVAVTPPR